MTKRHIQIGTAAAAIIAAGALFATSSGFTIPSAGNAPYGVGMGSAAVVAAVPAVGGVLPQAPTPTASGTATIKPTTTKPTHTAKPSTTKPTRPTPKTPSASPSATPTPTPLPLPMPVAQPPAFWWVWLIVAAAVIGLAVYLIGRRRISKDWDRRFEDAREELDWANNQLIPQILATSDPATAGALWQNASSRLTVVEKELGKLGRDGAKDVKKAKADKLRHLLVSLSLAVQAVANLPRGASAEDLSQARVEVESVRTQLHVALTEDAAGKQK